MAVPGHQEGDVKEYVREALLTNVGDPTDVRSREYYSVTLTQPRLIEHFDGDFQRGMRTSAGHQRRVVADGALLQPKRQSVEVTLYRACVDEQTKGAWEGPVQAGPLKLSVPAESFDPLITRLEAALPIDRAVLEFSTREEAFSKAGDMAAVPALFESMTITCGYAAREKATILSELINLISRRVVRLLWVIVALLGLLVTITLSR